LRFNNLLVENYRNIKKASVRLSNSLNVFCGGNAQGKTNLLEAACLCCIGKSYRGAKDRELIGFDSEYARVYSACESLSGPSEVCVFIPREGKKHIEVSGSSIAKMSELLGVIVCTIFSPDDLKLVKEGPSLRRRFMDIELCQLYPGYFSALVQYERALAQRNSLIRQCQDNPALFHSIDAWDEQLVKHGIKIVSFRTAYCEAVFEEAKSVHADISGGERLSCSYQPQTALVEGEKGFLRALNEGRREDLSHGATCIGPHRDDFFVLLNDMDIRIFGSQGQQRTAALSLKVAQLHHATKVLGEPPVFLLDDVLSELDEKRQKSLAENFDGLQSFLTCASESTPSVLMKANPFAYRVQDGEFKEI